MNTYLLTNDENEALSFCRAAGIDEHEATIVRSSGSLQGLRMAENDLILQFYSFRDHPDHDAIEDDFLQKLAFFGDEPKPRWVRAGQ